MDNFQNNNNLNNNENGQEQNNTQSSFSYDYAKNDTINTSGTVVEEKSFYKSYCLCSMCSCNFSRLNIGL